MTPTWPKTTQKQLWVLLHSLMRGDKHTVKSAMATLGIYALSQRVGELRKLGWNIHSKMTPVNDHTSVMLYWLAK